MRVQLEADQFKKEVEEYREAECVKIRRVLEEYEKDPEKNRKELGVASYNDFADSDPLVEKEVASMKNFLEKYGISQVS